MNYLSKENAQDLNLINKIISKAGYKGEVRVLVGGSKSFAFAVGDDVARFPKAEVVWQTMQRENQILSEIWPLVSDKFKNKIHQISLVDGEYPFVIIVMMMSMRLRFKIYQKTSKKIWLKLWLSSLP